jgi:hypothetical protein
VCEHEVGIACYSEHGRRRPADRRIDDKRVGSIAAFAGLRLSMAIGFSPAAAIEIPQ